MPMNDDLVAEAREENRHLAERIADAGYDVRRGDALHIYEVLRALEEEAYALPDLVETQDASPDLRRRMLLIRDLVKVVMEQYERDEERDYDERA